MVRLGSPSQCRVRRCEQTGLTGPAHTFPPRRVRFQQLLPAISFAPSRIYVIAAGISPAFSSPPCGFGHTSSPEFPCAAPGSLPLVAAKDAERLGGNQKTSKSFGLSSFALVLASMHRFATAQQATERVGAASSIPRCRVPTARISLHRCQWTASTPKHENYLTTALGRRGDRGCPDLSGRVRGSAFSK
jgi:hypothetical protein